MIKRMVSSGNWVVQGVQVPQIGESMDGVAAVYIKNDEMQAFIHAEAQKLADRALAILIEHQRKTLLPEQRTENGE